MYFTPNLVATDQPFICFIINVLFVCLDQRIFTAIKGRNENHFIAWDMLDSNCLVVQRRCERIAFASLRCAGSVCNFSAARCKGLRHTFLFIIRRDRHGDLSDAKVAFLDDQMQLKTPHPQYAHHQYLPNDVSSAWHIERSQYP